jgi:hypothetical protein
MHACSQTDFIKGFHWLLLRCGKAKQKELVFEELPTELLISVKRFRYEKTLGQVSKVRTDLKIEQEFSLTCEQGNHVSLFELQFTMYFASYDNTC